MIRVTKLNKKEEYYINPLLIEKVEETPDVVVTLLNNKKYVVGESINELLALISDYYKIIGTVTPQIIYSAYNLDEE